MDYTKGIVTRLGLGETGEQVVTEYLNPVEVLPGKWLYTLHRLTIHFPTGDELQTESSLSNIQVNQGLSDALFAIPE